jgi:hypothetical protein
LNNIKYNCPAPVPYMYKEGALLCKHVSGESPVATAVLPYFAQECLRCTAYEAQGFGLVCSGSEDTLGQSRAIQRWQREILLTHVAKKGALLVTC